MYRLTKLSLVHGVFFTLFPYILSPLYSTSGHWVWRRRRRLQSWLLAGPAPPHQQPLWKVKLRLMFWHIPLLTVLSSQVSAQSLWHHLGRDRVETSHLDIWLWTQKQCKARWFTLRVSRVHTPNTGSKSNTSTNSILNSDNEEVSKDETKPTIIFLKPPQSKKNMLLNFSSTTWTGRCWSWTCWCWRCMNRVGRRRRWSQGRWCRCYSLSLYPRTHLH